MGSTVFRNPRALSSALAALGTLQPRALGFLNTVDPLDTVSNCYIDSTVETLCIVSSGHEVLACMHAVQVHPVGEHASFLHLSVVYC